MAADDDSPAGTLTDVIVGVAWYFGGAALLIAGYPMWAAITVTIGALACWRWRLYERRDPMPPIPHARLLGRKTKP